MSLFSGLDATAGALSAFGAALNVVQNNVNNASTPGFAKQIQTLQAMAFLPGTGDSGGVEAGAVLSTRDQYAEQHVRTATAQLGTYEQQVQSLTPVQSQFDISGKSGVPAAFNQLFSAFTNWAANPNDATTRQSIIDTAGNVATSFRTNASNLSHIAQSTDTQIGGLVDQVNTLAAKLGSYNEQIASNAQSDPALDAAVNNTIEQLSEVASVTTIHEPDGTFNVMLSGQTELVSGATVNKLNATVYVPSHASMQSGSVPVVPIKIVPGQNDTLNLKIDGAAVPSIQLSPTDTTPAAVAADIQAQLTAAGSSAVASADSQGRISIASGTTGPTASVEALPGNANATLAFTSNPPPSMRITDVNGVDVTATASMGGKLGGILQVRNQVLPELTGASDETGSLNVLAKQFADRVNTIIGAPLFTYNNESGTDVAATLQVNGSVTAQQLAAPQVVSLTGTAPAGPLSISAGSNDGLNLVVDGTAAAPITLSPSDTDMTTVAADLNRQFSTLGIGAHAAINGNTGALMLSTTGTGPTASIQIAAGTANSTLGLAQTTPTYKSSANAVALELASLANPQSAADQINGQSYTQFFGSMAASVGSKLATAKDGQSAQQELVTQAQSIRQQISGVDLNEEAAKVLQFQSAYQAASKMMSVIDTLTQTVIGLIPQG